MKWYNKLLVGVLSIFAGRGVLYLSGVKSSETPLFFAYGLTILSLLFFTRIEHYLNNYKKSKNE